MMDKGLFKTVFVFAIIFIVGSLLFRGSLVMRNMNEGKPTYIIKVPSYNGEYTSYMCNSYTEQNGCIQFKDEFGFEQKICQQYTIEKWK